MLVSNTGPLIALGDLELLQLLQDLFGSVKVTESVHREVTTASEKPLADLFSHHPWIQVVPDPPMPDTWLATMLDQGEATTVALALKEQADYLLIDERKGRRVAEKIYSLRIIGTVGVLLRAKARQRVPAIRPLLFQLREAGYYLHPNLIDKVCRAAGEEPCTQ